MKVYIISAALVAFIALSFVFFVESNSFLEYDAVLEEVTENAVNAAALCLDEEALGEGYIAYDHAKGEEKIKQVLDATYHFSPGTLEPENEHFQEDFTYETWYFDKTPSGYHVSKYVEGTLDSENDEYFGVELPNGSHFTPDYPSVVLFVRSGKLEFISEIMSNNVNHGNGIEALKIYEEKERY